MRKLTIFAFAVWALECSGCGGGSSAVQSGSSSSDAGGAPNAGDASSGGDGGSSDASALRCSTAPGCEVVASAQNGPYGIAADDTGVYWANIGTAPNYADGSIVKLARGSAAPVVLADGEHAPRFLAVDASNVYYTSYYGWTVRRVPKSGGTAVTLAGGSYTRSIAVAGTSLVWANGGPNGSIARLPLEADAIADTSIATGQSSPLGIAVGADALFWTNLTGASVAKVALSDVAAGTAHAVVTVAERQDTPSIIAASGTDVVWTNSGDGSVMRATSTGGAPVALATGQKTPWGVAVSGASVYFANAGDGTVHKVALAGGAVSTIATGARTPRLVAVSSDGVYVSDEGANAVFRIPR